MAVTPYHRASLEKSASGSSRRQAVQKLSATRAAETQLYTQVLTVGGKESH